MKEPKFSIAKRNNIAIPLKIHGKITNNLIKVQENYVKSVKTATFSLLLMCFLIHTRQKMPV